jgi:hypothetical protein
MKTKNEILAEIKFTLIKKHNIDALDDALINDCVEMTLKAINYTHCSELLICLDNGNYEMLTNYKLYKLVSESKSYYNLYDDDGKLVQMSKVRFKKVVANINLKN